MKTENQTRFTIKKNLSQKTAFLLQTSHSRSADSADSASCASVGRTGFSLGASHHRHFGMSSSYSLPHFLQIMIFPSQQTLLVKLEIKM